VVCYYRIESTVVASSCDIGFQMQVSAIEK
jgi:hypothetical protein